MKNDNIIQTMINKVYQFIEKYNMFQENDSIIVGISGGADSVCLTLILAELRERAHMSFQLTAVHVNHGIRGDEALRDQKFSQELCEKLNIPFICYEIDVPAMAKEQGISEEEAGRKARYDLFSQTADKIECSGHTLIAVAHHKNDQAETVLMNLLRGSGLKGICGIQPVREQGTQRIIRPLLCVTREEIEEYLSERNQNYITDSTNQDSEYTRNKIRNNLIPYLKEEFNPNVIGTICNLAENLSKTEVYLERQAATLYRSAVTFTEEMENVTARIKVSEVSNADPMLGELVVRKAIGQVAGALKDIYRTHVEQCLGLCSLQVGRQINLPYGLSAIRDYEVIIITAKKAEKERDICIEINKDQIGDLLIGDILSVPVKQYVYIPGKGNVFLNNINLEILESLENSLNNDYTKYFDYDKIYSNIYLRFKRAGDSIVIHPDGSTKKLKKDFTDRKISKENRDNILLLTDEEHILWAIGVRRGEDNRIDNKTRRILKISVKLQEE